MELCSRDRSSVSIALCTFNGEAYLREQLDSLASQTRRSEEVVIGDDGSIDGTLEIIGRFIRSRPDLNVRLLESDAHLGYRENFMRTAEACTGRYVAFCDQDDVWRDDKIERSEDLLAASGSVMLFHNYDVVDRVLHSIGPAFPLEADQEIRSPLSRSPWDFPLGFSIVFSRSLMQHSKLRYLTIDPFSPKEHLAHDQWIPLLGNALGKTIYTPQALAQYRQHGKNLFGRNYTSTSRMRSWQKAAEKVLRYSDYTFLSDVSKSLVDVFRVIAGDTDSAALERYSAVARAYAARAECYSGHSVFQRLGAWKALRADGFYGGSGQVHFTNRAQERDLVLGALTPEWLRRRIAICRDHDNSLALG